MGWARQPGRLTVEGEILRGLVRRGIAPSSEEARLEVASRTDRGVSAVGNALALSSSRSASVLLRALNGTAPDMAFTAASPVPDRFRTRAATRRVYRYFEPGRPASFDRWGEVAQLFSGTVDVRSLGRALPRAEPVWRTVESVDVTLRPGGAMVEVRAPSFVWGMVRKIVAALREVQSGRISPEQLRGALEGRSRLTLPMAEAERLLLWDVEYPIPWEFHWSGPNRHQSRWAGRVEDGLWARARLLESFRGRDSPTALGSRSRSDAR